MYIIEIKENIKNKITPKMYSTAFIVNIPFVVAIACLYKFKLINETNVIVCLLLAIVHNALIFQGNSPMTRFCFVLLYLLILCFIALHTISRVVLGTDLTSLLKGLFKKKEKKVVDPSHFETIKQYVYTGIESV